MEKYDRRVDYNYTEFVVVNYSFCCCHVKFSFQQNVIAGAVDDLKGHFFQQHPGSTAMQMLTQLILKLMVTSSCRDTVCGELAAVQQPLKSPLGCIVEVL